MEALRQLFTLQLITQDTRMLQQSSLMPHFESGKINFIPALTSVLCIWVACSSDLNGTKGKGIQHSSSSFSRGPPTQRQLKEPWVSHRFSKASKYNKIFETVPKTDRNPRWKTVFFRKKNKQGREFGSPFSPNQYQIIWIQASTISTNSSFKGTPIYAGNFFKAKNGFKEGLPCSSSCS